jgi:hypothetical protein
MNGRFEHDSKRGKCQEEEMKKRIGGCVEKLAAVWNHDVGALAGLRIAHVGRARISIITLVNLSNTDGLFARVRVRTCVSVVASDTVFDRIVHTETVFCIARILCARISIITHNRLCHTDALVAKVVFGAKVSIIARRVWRWEIVTTGLLIAVVIRASIFVITHKGVADALVPFAGIIGRARIAIVAIVAFVGCVIAKTKRRVTGVNRAFDIILTRFDGSFALIFHANVTERARVFITARVFVLHKILTSSFLDAGVRRALFSIVALNDFSRANTELTGRVFRAGIVVIAKEDSGEWFKHAHTVLRVARVRCALTVVRAKFLVTDFAHRVLAMVSNRALVRIRTLRAGCGRG